MKQLQWEEAACTSFLGVAPETSIDGVDDEYIYRIEKSGLTLELAIYPRESSSIIWLLQGSSGPRILQLVLLVRGDLRPANDEDRMYLRFSNCVVVSNQYYGDNREDVFDSPLFPDELTLQLYVEPHIEIKFQ